MQEMLTIVNHIGVNGELVRHKFLQALPPQLALVIALQKHN